MMTVFNQGLIITAIGMALVFVMILALWGIMALLVKLTTRAENDEEPPEEITVVVAETKPAEDTNARLAAAIAVAYAIESETESYAFQSSTGAAASMENAWWTAGRTQQLYTNTIRGRNR